MAFLSGIHSSYRLALYIPLRHPLLLPVHIVLCKFRPNTEGLHGWSLFAVIDGHAGHKTATQTAVLLAATIAAEVAPVYGARFSDRNLHSKMPLVPMRLLRLKLLHACDHWHASRVSAPLTGWHCKFMSKH
jgi:hypothetical protein